MEKIHEIPDIKVEYNIPIPKRSRTGLSAALRKLDKEGATILLPPGFKKTSLHPTAKSLGFKIRYQEEYSETQVKKWSEKFKVMAWQNELTGIRVWRIN